MNTRKATRDASLLAVVLALAVLSPATAGPTHAPQSPQNPVEIFPVDELRPGMTGVGYTVVQGTEAQEFQVEILGILHDIMPKQDLVVARLSGLGLAESGIASGMSGSPVYIDGRLLGAVSYRLGAFPKEPIAGITPIRLMLDLEEREAAASADRVADAGRVADVARVADAGRVASVGGPTAAARSTTAARSATVPPTPGESLLTAAAELLSGQAGVALPSMTPTLAGGAISPIATPVTVSGSHPEVVERLQPLFRSLGWTPTLGGTASGAEVNEEFRPGSAVAVHLMRGDITFTASGTVTHVDGDRLWAFGHSFMQGGNVDFPLSGAEVLVVLSDLSASQKLTTAGTRMLGRIRQDRASGIFGVLGDAPAMIPVTLDVSGPAGLEERFEFEMISDKTLSPTFLFFGLANGMQSVGTMFGDSTFEVKGKFYLETADGGEPVGPVEIRNLFSSPSQAYIPLSQTTMSIFAFLYDNDFEPVDVRSVELEVVGGNDRRVAQISRVWADKLVVRPGEEVQLSIWLEPYRQEPVVERMSVRIPSDVPPGPLSLLVGDASAVSREEQGFIQGTVAPSSLHDLVRLLNDIRVNDSVYVQASRPDRGAFFGGRPMPSLPTSMLQILGSAKTSGEVVELRNSVLLEKKLPVDYVVSGQHRIELRVRR